MADQGAGRNSGQAAGGGRFVKFSHGSAKRIAKAVRIVEGGNRDQPPLTFEHPIPGASPLKLATVTGQWATGATASLTFYGITNTVSVQNLHMPVEVATGASAECVIGKAGGTWTLVSVNFGKLKAFAANKVQVLGHNDEGYAQWYSVTTCATSTSA